jgi:hypothetical protein
LLTISGRDGRFHFAGLCAGEVRMLARRGGERAMFRDAVVVPPEGIRDLELKVQ